MKIRFLISLFALSAVSVAQADVYKCTDSAGRATYTNEKPSAAAQQSCTLLSKDQSISTIPSGGGSVKSGGGTGSSAAKAPTPASFPKVDNSTQKGRDDTRRSILQQELSTEEKALEDSKKELASQEAVREGGERNYQKYLDRVQPYKDKVALHERNAEAIRKEISNLK